MTVIVYASILILSIIILVPYLYMQSSEICIFFLKGTQVLVQIIRINEGYCHQVYLAGYWMICRLDIFILRNFFG